MTSNVARKLQIDDRVGMRIYGKMIEGLVVEVTTISVRIRWDDGVVGNVHHNDMADIMTIRREHA